MQNYVSLNEQNLNKNATEMILERRNAVKMELAKLKDLKEVCQQDQFELKEVLHKVDHNTTQIQT